MTASEFMAIGPMFASEDVTRPSLNEPFRCGGHLFATDGRIALVLRAMSMQWSKIAETSDESRLNIGKLIMDMVELNDAKIASGKYRGYRLGSISEAAIAAFANVEPEMMWLRANEPDHPHYAISFGEIVYRGTYAEVKEALEKKKQETERMKR